MVGAVGATTLTGFHGCEREVAERLVDGEPFRQSVEPHQWLGAGVYFWDGDSQRALEWAEERSFPTPFKVPTVVRVDVTFTSGLNMDLREHQALIESLYPAFEAELAGLGLPVPQNVPHPAGPGRPSIVRMKDHAVIEFLCRTVVEEAEAERAAGRVPDFEPLQVIEGSFQGWKPIYPGGGFYMRSHRQFCVRDPSCIEKIEIEGVYRKARRP